MSDEMTSGEIARTLARIEKKLDGVVTKDMLADQVALVNIRINDIAADQAEMKESITWARRMAIAAVVTLILLPVLLLPLLTQR